MNKKNLYALKAFPLKQSWRVLPLTFLFSWLICSSLWAQTGDVSGKVTDSSGEAIQGVSIVVKGMETATLTDADGQFSLKAVDANAILVFTFIGLKTQEVSLNGRTVLDVKMEERSSDLDEVVVIGYGSTVQKKDLTGAISTISGVDIADRQTIQISQALQGAVPGLSVTRDGGAANVSGTIRVRGITTIGDSDPLVIIDGVPGTLDWVNPNDVESMSVLKDAASAAIYGSRAAAGVILVTTKRAKSGQLNLDYNVQYGFETPTRIARYADAQTYMRVHNERNWNDNNNIGTEFPVFAENVVNNYQELNQQNPNLYPITDWMGILVRDNVPRQSHSINLSAGSDNVKTNVSMIYDQTEAFYNGRDYDRITVRANNDFTINKYLSLEADLNGMYTLDNRPAFEIGPDIGVAPIYAALWDDGRIAQGQSGVNPYARLNYGGFSENRAMAVRGRVALHFKPIEGLRISGVFSPELYSDKVKNFSRQLTYTSPDDPNMQLGYVVGATQTMLNEFRNDNHTITSQFLANYTKSLGQHNVEFMLGNENFHYFSETLGARREQYELTDFPYLDLGNQNYQYNNGSAFENAYRSFFGRAMYDYDNRYYLQVNARYDGSSRFHQDYRWGMFPSISGGWVLSEEEFFNPNPAVLSFLKVRASWGRLGNERIGNYPYQSTIGFGNALFYQGQDVVANQTAAIMRYAIPDISWETTESYNFGLDASLFNSRLTVTADYYKKTTRDMLLALAIPDYIGLENPDQNTGDMYTKGWDLELSWSDKVGDFGYSVSLNLSDYRSIMGNLGGTQFLGNQATFEGSEFNEWYGYRSAGLYQRQEEVDNSARLSNQVGPGDIRYLDVSGPGGNPDGFISAEYDRVLLGGSLPRYLYGGIIRLNYKNFDFSTVIQGVGKQLSQATTAMVQPLRNQYIEVPNAIVGNYWSHYNTPEQNQQVAYPRVSDIGFNNNYSAFSDYWLFNGAYLRVKNITFGYAIPKQVTEKLKIQFARIYLTANDVFSFDNFPQGWDPEASTYWIPATFMAGITLKF